MLKKKTSVAQYIIMFVLLLISLTMVYPFLYLLFVSISPIEQVIKSGALLIPKGIDLTSYKYVLRAVGIGAAYKTTIIVTVLGTLLSLLLTTVGAYVISIRRLPGRRFLVSILIITMVFSGGLMPTYLVVKSLKLIDQLAALFLPTAINTFWLFVMRNFFYSIPESLTESARIDGCSEYRILWSIIIPVSGSIIATLALFYAVGLWNQYFYAIIYINSTFKRPLQIVIRMMYQSSTLITAAPDDIIPPPVETIRAATILIATVPILCIYPFLQKYFLKGIMVGAVKG